MLSAMILAVALGQTPQCSAQSIVTYQTAPVLVAVPTPLPVVRYEVTATPLFAVGACEVGLFAPRRVLFPRLRSLPRALFGGCGG